MRPTDEIILVRVDAVAARGRLALWLPLYLACFTPPPWNEAPKTFQEYTRHTHRHLGQPGFAAFEAQTASGRLVGVAYGWPGADPKPDTDFYRALEHGLGPERTRELRRGPAFEVAELMVDTSTRGRGLARHLLETHCQGQELAWLATRPDVPAAGMYRHLGWRSFGTFGATTWLEVFCESSASRESSGHPG